MSHAEQQKSEAAIPPRTTESAHGIGGVLKIAPYRRFWTAIAASALADWLGLLALTSAALWTVDGDYMDHAAAVAAVFVLRLLPSALVAPLAGQIVDRLDRRWTMVACDVFRLGLLVSVPLVDELWWILAATALGGIAGAFWGPARDATVPNLVPRQRMATATQFNLVTGYAAAPVAAVLFIVLALVTRLLAPSVDTLDSHPADLALYATAAVHLLSALYVYLLHMPTRGRSVSARRPNPLVVLADGRRVFGHSPTSRGLVTGMLALFLAGGVLVGLTPLYTAELGAGNAAYGTVFLALLAGVALGLLWGPKVVPAFSRRRLFGLAVITAGLVLLVVGLVPNVVVTVVLTALLGLVSGVAWVTGYTMFGVGVGEELRGRAFAFVQAAVRLTLLVGVVAGSLVAGAIGLHTWTAADRYVFTYNGSALTLAAPACSSPSSASACSARSTTAAASRWPATSSTRPATSTTSPAARPTPPATSSASRAAKASASPPRSRRSPRGSAARATRSSSPARPGATEIGKRLRAMLLDVENTGIDPRAEALLYAADRAEHVATVIRPALERGAIVITDRYVDSSVAYQGAGRELGAREIARVSRWATDGLQPDLTVLLDLDPEIGHARFTEAPTGSSPNRRASTIWCAARSSTWPPPTRTATWSSTPRRSRTPSPPRSATASTANCRCPSRRSARPKNWPAARPRKKPAARPNARRPKPRSRPSSPGCAPRARSASGSPSSSASPRRPPARPRSSGSAPRKRCAAAPRSRSGWPPKRSASPTRPRPGRKPNACGSRRKRRGAPPSRSVSPRKPSGVPKRRASRPRKKSASATSSASASKRRPRCAPSATARRRRPSARPRPSAASAPRRSASAAARRPTRRPRGAARRRPLARRRPSARRRSGRRPRRPCGWPRPSAVPPRRKRPARWSPRPPRRPARPRKPRRWRTTTTSSRRRGPFRRTATGRTAATAMAAATTARGATAAAAARPVRCRRSRTPPNWRSCGPAR
ncbi:dTMP kinase [Yinghuangia aomiensis]